MSPRRTREAVARRGEIAAELSRRELIRDASALSLGALVAAALPAADRLGLVAPAQAQVSQEGAILQAFADTIIPGRRAERTDLGDEIHPQAIAGVDPEPGAVEADVLRLMNSPLIGYRALAPPLIAELSARSLPLGGAFLGLPYERRVEVVKAGLDFGNETRVIWEAGAAACFAAFCGGGMQPVGTSANASGYRVMGYPGAAPRGYPRSFSYRRRLARGRTRRGSLP